MKSLLLAAALLLATFTNKTFASDLTVSPIALKTFHATFSEASNVQWTTVDHLYRADFTVRGERTVAFFNSSDGKLVVTCRYLTVSQLPAALQQSLKAHTASAVLIDLFEVQENDSRDYFAQIKRADEILMLKSSTFHKWKHYKQ